MRWFFFEVGMLERGERGCNQLWVGHDSRRVQPVLPLKPRRRPWTSRLSELRPPAAACLPSACLPSAARLLLRGPRPRTARRSCASRAAGRAAKLKTIQIGSAILTRSSTPSFTVARRSRGPHATDRHISPHSKEKAHQPLTSVRPFTQPVYPALAGGWGGHHRTGLAVF